MSAKHTPKDNEKTGKGRSEVRVHFMAAIYGDRPTYEHICRVIETLGYHLVSKHIITRKYEEVLKETQKQTEKIHRDLMFWIDSADIVVYDVTISDVSIGYEVGRAFSKFKPVIILYNERTGQVPHALKAFDTPLLRIVPYNNDSLPGALEDALERALEETPRRFCVFLAPSLARYLEWISDSTQEKYSTYLRYLVAVDMVLNKTYQAHLQEHSTPERSSDYYRTLERAFSSQDITQHYADRHLPTSTDMLLDLYKNVAHAQWEKTKATQLVTTRMQEWFEAALSQADEQYYQRSDATFATILAEYTGIITNLENIRQHIKSSEE